MDDTVAAFAAKTHFSQLLERVAKGECITITRHGTPVARLVPARPAADKARVREAIARLKEFGKRHSLGGLDWQELRDEGRR
jgi:prevent-host-death family protein